MDLQPNTGSEGVIIIDVMTIAGRIAGTQYLIDVNYVDSAPNCGTTSDQNQAYAYNPASQIVQRSASNDAYAWSGPVDGTTAYAPDGRRGPWTKVWWMGRDLVKPDQKGSKRVCH